MWFLIALCFDMKELVKIFCIYHGNADLPLYKSDCIQPIQSGSAITNSREGVWRDDTGDNISTKNSVWAELCVHYWVWKNWLNANRDVKYIGFSHYRRFLDFRRKPWREIKLIGKYLPYGMKYEAFEKFGRNFQKRFCTQVIWPYIQGYDIIVPAKKTFPYTIREQWIAEKHPVHDLENLCAIIRDRYPDYVVDMENLLCGNSMHAWCNYVFKREYMEEYLQWEFDVFERLEKISNWGRAEDLAKYESARIPAFLMERFVNVWIMHKVRTDNAKLLERQFIKLVPEAAKPSFFLRLYGLFLRMLHIRPTVYTR